jgi:copper(I)-binding protein
MTTRRHFLAAGLGLPLALPAAACDFFSSHLRIWHPWTRATRAGAETARLFMRFDEVQRTDRLIGIETPVAGGARLIDRDGPRPLSLLIEAGHDLTLSEDGLHIELLDLQHPLQIGRSFPLRLIFESADPVNAMLNVDLPALR